MQTPATRTKMTAAEFAQLPESNQFIELIEGELVVSPTPVNRHQQITGNIYFQLQLLVNQHPEIGIARISPLEIHLDEFNILEPDVFFISALNTHCTLADNGYWYGAPDLVVEVLSPSTAKNDRQGKFQLYERFGVLEYWIVDPVHNTLDQWLLVDERFTLAGIYGLGDGFASDVLAADFSVDRLFI